MLAVSLPFVLRLVEALSQHCPAYQEQLLSNHVLDCIHAIERYVPVCAGMLVLSPPCGCWVGVELVLPLLQVVFDRL